MSEVQVPLPRPYFLASVATLVGLFVPGFYRDASVLLPQVSGRIC